MAFPPDKVAEWEADDCVNFAIALARITGWLLHVDWLSDEPTPDSSRPVEKMTPLRVYMGSDGEDIFDVRGIKPIHDFTLKIIRPLLKEWKKPWVQQCGVATRHYDEADLAGLPLHSPPDEAKIQDATDVIRSVSGYLAAIPERPWPRLPAKAAATFTWGMCSIYAEALSDETGLQAAALLVQHFRPMYEGTKRSEKGYVHSFVLHPDGTAEDSWGRVPLQRLADRFGAAAFTVDQAEHQRVVGNLKRNTPDRWEQRYKEAVELVHRFRNVDQ
ncbi:MAG: hypothetical protein IAF94_20070 [Pirellulaceae bacterium]|nr:hypothetical protein [Pirellulaceae bacterium]